jgi:hypothetical protein
MYDDSTDSGTVEKKDCSPELKDKIMEVISMSEDEGIDPAELIAQYSGEEDSNETPSEDSMEITEGGDTEDDKAKKRKIVVMALKKKMGSEGV